MTHPDGLHVLDQPGDVPGAPLVAIVHGAMDRAASFGRVARQLGHLHLVRYDRRGYGRSAGMAPGTLDDHVEDLLAILGGRPATVFGHSIGGVVALIAAQRSPDVVRSVLVYEAPTPWAPWWPAPGRPPLADDGDEAEAFMRRAIGDRFWERLPARTRADRRAEGGALRADVASIQGPEAPFEAASVDVPVLVGVGADTTWWHARAARELASELESAELRAVAGASHGVHLTHPTATADLISEAVARR